MAAAEDWVARTAAQVRAEGERWHPGEVPTCASGISPSGPVHLGNLRELMTPHLVADEVRRNGAPCRHILSWDDYDRLRRVPAGLPDSFTEHIGRPLTGVPDPCGQHENFAAHFKAPLARLAGPPRDPGHRDQPDRDVHLRRLHGADRAGHAAARRHRRGPGQVPHQARRRGRRGRAAGRGVLPVPAVLRVLRPGRHHRDRLRRRDHRDHLYLRLRRGRGAACRSRTWPGSWPGRSTGRCGGPTST